MVHAIVLTLSLAIFAGAQLSAGVPLARSDATAEERAGYFQGDMRLNSLQKALLVSTDEDLRNGRLNETYRWPNNTVLYKVVSKKFDVGQLGYIQKALETISNVSCLTFREADENATAYIEVQSEKDGCFSDVGYQGKVQVLNLEPYELDSGCFRLGTIVHEFLHALGFFHMQSASERDDYVEIVWKNIRPGTEHNFEKYNTSLITNFGVAYDYGSVLHYSATAFSTNGNDTIVPKQANVTIGQREKMSESDILKLNKMYKCEK